VLAVVDDRNGLRAIAIVDGVGDDAAFGGRRAGVDRGVARGRVRARVRENDPAVERAARDAPADGAVLREVGQVALERGGGELVEHDEHHDAWPRIALGGGRRTGAARRQGDGHRGEPASSPAHALEYGAS
jgi:hypothetical protein